MPGACAVRVSALVRAASGHAAAAAAAASAAAAVPVPIMAEGDGESNIPARVATLHERNEKVARNQGWSNRAESRGGASRFAIRSK